MATLAGFSALTHTDLHTSHANWMWDEDTNHMYTCLLVKTFWFHIKVKSEEIFMNSCCAETILIVMVASMKYEFFSFEPSHAWENWKVFIEKMCIRYTHCFHIRVWSKSHISYDILYSSLEIWLFRVRWNQPSLLYFPVILASTHGASLHFFFFFLFKCDFIGWAQPSFGSKNKFSDGIFKFSHQNSCECRWRKGNAPKTNV